MAESFCRVFELKSVLFEFYFFELSLFESSIGSMMINTLSPGSRGSLAASRAAVAGRDLALLPLQPGEIVYCKSRIFRMHEIFVYFVRGGFRTKIKCMRNVQSKSENQQRSATVRKFHADVCNLRLESPGYEN